MLRSWSRNRFFLLAAIALLLSACGGSTSETTVAPDNGRPVIVATTNILGDVVEQLVGDSFEVVTIMPVGVDPHDFQASAQQVAQIAEADVIIANGAAFEEGLLDVIEAAEDDGVPVYEAISAVQTLEFGDDNHHDDHDDDGDDHDDDGDDHDDDGDDHDDDGDDHGHEGVDPHFFTDPARMALAADGIVAFLGANVDGADAEALTEGASSYIAELVALDAEVEAQLGSIDEGQRVLITNHEVFGYFAERYEFEVAGAIIPSGSTADSANAAALVELAELIEDEGVQAIFADASSSDDLVNALAGEVGEVAVVELFSESLGANGGATYIEMVRTNAERITAALSS